MIMTHSAINLTFEKSPEIIDEIKGHFTEDGAYTKDTAAKEIAGFMSGDNICVIVARQEKKIVGFIVAWIPKDRKFCWMDQIWHSLSGDEETALCGMSMLTDWAADRGVYELRGETRRNDEAARRKWGFVVHSLIMVRYTND